MSTLNDKLKRLKENFLKSAPEEAVAIMSRATQALRDSGIMDGIPKVGDPLPAFALEDTEGHTVGSDQLLAKGPLVMTFYRGVW